MAPAGVEIWIYEDIGLLPHFNPDLEIEAPGVTALKERLRASDGFLISSPEYAHGVPGTLKNALDWLVSGSEMVGKPVALFSASPRAIHAQDSLKETLLTMSARFVSEASVSVPLLGKTMATEEVVAHPEISKTLREVLGEFVKAIRTQKTR